MPGYGSIANDVADFLRPKKGGATMREIGDAVRARRGHVLQHSVRSAVYRHLGDQGEALFRRESVSETRHRYFLKQ